MAYQTVSIGAAHWQAEIAPEYGANPVSVRYRGQDVLVPWSEDITDPFLIGAPLLLPANRTAGGRFCFGGTEYRLPVNNPFSNANLHGDLYHQHFRVIEQESDYVRLDYVNQGEIYPFSFRVSVTYRVGDEGFSSEYIIENLSASAMPLTFGLHTTFPEPDQFRVPLAACQEKVDRHIPTGRYIPLNPQEELYCTGSPSRDLVISGFYLAGGETARIGPKLHYRVTGFDHWVLYNGRGEGGFLCIEPQLGGVNALNSPTNCPVLRKEEALHLKTLLWFTSDTAPD